MADIMGAIAAAINGGMKGYQWGQSLQDDQRKHNQEDADRSRATSIYLKGLDDDDARNRAGFDYVKGIDKSRASIASGDVNTIDGATSDLVSSNPQAMGQAVAPMMAVRAALAKASAPPERVYDPKADYNTQAAYADKSFNLDHVTRRDNQAAQAETLRETNAQRNTDRTFRLEKLKADALSASPAQLAQSAQTEGATPEEVASITVGGQNAVHVYTATMQAISARKAQAAENARHAATQGSAVKAALHSAESDVTRTNSAYRQMLGRAPRPSQYRDDVGLADKPAFDAARQNFVSDSVATAGDRDAANARLAGARSDAGIKAPPAPLTVPAAPKLVGGYSALQWRQIRQNAVANPSNPNSKQATLDANAALAQLGQP